MTDLTIVGAGDVVSKRFVPALLGSQKELGLRLNCIVDVRPVEEVTSQLHAAGVHGALRVCQLQDASPEGLVSLLTREAVLESPIAVTTPSMFHAAYARALLERDCRVGLEKPFALNHQQIHQLDAFVNSAGTARLFLFGYYALEKGLGAYSFALGADAPAPYLDLLTPRPDSDTLIRVREALGAVTDIRAALLEGKGPASTLDERLWVLDPANGGNTLETFYHLVCLATVFVPATRLTIRETHLACHDGVKYRYEREWNRTAAETLTYARLASDAGASVRLLCAKYVSEQVHERWLRIDFERGHLLANFESGQLDVQSPLGRLTFRRRFDAHYASQLSLFKAKLDDPTVRTEYEPFRDALLLTLAIRDDGMARGLTTYSTDEIDREYVDGLLRRHL